jgi:hypothetical protein
LPADLRDELFGSLQPVETSKQIGASSDELGGLPAMRAEFTMAGGRGPRLLWPATATAPTSSLRCVIGRKSARRSSIPSVSPTLR